MPSQHLMVLAGYHKIPVAVDNTNSGMATHYNTITLQHCHLLVVVRILSPLQFLINCWFYHVLGCKNVKICRDNWLKWWHLCMHIYTPYQRHTQQPLAWQPPLWLPPLPSPLTTSTNTTTTSTAGKGREGRQQQQQQQQQQPGASWPMYVFLYFFIYSTNNYLQVWHVRQQQCWHYHHFDRNDDNQQLRFDPMYLFLILFYIFY